MSWFVNRVLYNGLQNWIHVLWAQDRARQQKLGYLAPREMKEKKEKRVALGTRFYAVLQVKEASL